MIFTDKTILDSINKGEIVVQPFIHANLGTNSIDLTLAPHLVTYINAEDYIAETYHLGRRSFQISDNVYKSVHATDGYFIDSKANNETRKFEIPEEGFILQPGQLYIASTNEYTETWNAVPKLEGRSSLGRLGLFIHVTAGYGDVGFCGQWTLELVATIPLRIYPNMKICQISYHGISEKPNIGYDKKESAKYSGQMGATASKMHENF